MSYEMCAISSLIPDSSEKEQALVALSPFLLAWSTAGLRVPPNPFQGCLWLCVCPCGEPVHSCKAPLCSEEQAVVLETPSFRTTLVVLPWT